MKRFLLIELDLAFVNGHVFDGVTDAPVRMNVGISGGVIVTLNSDRVQAGITTSTRVIDIAGQLLLPGFFDSHVHPIEAGLERLSCDLSPGWTREDYISIIGDYARTRPSQDWIVGGGWQQAAFHRGAPVADDLDAISMDRPIVMSNRDHHSAWVNSVVLRMIGIDKNYPDPIDGRIERDADGNPTGTLHEGARMLALQLAPQPSMDDQYAALLDAQGYLHSFGVTGWHDALIGDYGNHSSRIIDVYDRALKQNQLRARVNGALWWDRNTDENQIRQILSIRERFQNDLFRITAVKVMQDGVVENQSAAMIDSYINADSPGSEPSHGISFISPRRLNAYVVRLDSLGLQVHFHAIGDRAVREALDAVAAARQINPLPGIIHQIAHIQVVHPDDISRFASLNVAANIQPLWASNDPQMVKLNIPIIGEERSAWQYPFSSLLAGGAQLCAGSDWPVTSPDPWLGIHVAVNRTVPRAHPDYNADVFGPGERLSLSAAIRAYTSAAAYVNGRGDRTGKIAVGYHADCVVVDRNPFDYPAANIAETRTVETFFGGTSVYLAEQSST